MRKLSFFLSMKVSLWIFIAVATIRTTIAMAQNPALLIASCCSTGGKCVGSINCRACSTCEYCRYCNSGGSCGVCGGGTSNTPIYTPPERSNINTGYNYPTPPTYFYPTIITPPATDEKTTNSLSHEAEMNNIETEIENGFNNQHLSLPIQEKRFYNTINGKKEYATFKGSLKDGKPHGYGYLLYDNGDWFKGTYNHGERCGKGISFFSSSNTKVIRDYTACD